MIQAGDVFGLRVAWQTKLLLLAMLHDAGGQPECDVARVGRLAERTGLTTATVKNSLADLRAAGALRPDRGRLRVELTALPKQAPFRGRKTGSRGYRLNLDVLPKKADRGAR